MSDALTRGQLVVGAVVGAVVVAGAAAWALGMFESHSTRTCTLTPGMEVPILPTRDRALSAAGAAMMGRASEEHLAGAFWVPGGTVVTVHDTSGAAVRVSTPRGSGWVAEMLCR